MWKVEGDAVEFGSVGTDTATLRALAKLAAPTEKWRNEMQARTDNN